MHSESETDESSEHPATGERTVSKPERSDDQIAREQRRQTRRRLWLVLLALLLGSIAITAWQWYQGEYVVGDKPVNWRKATWTTVERELKSGRRMIVFVADENDQQANSQFLAQFETPEIRKQIFYSQRIPLKLVFSDDKDSRADSFSALHIDQTPCCVLSDAKKQAVVVAGQMTPSEIADKIKE